MYTFDEYSAMVKKSLLKSCGNSEKEISIAEKYFNSDEAQKQIKARYAIDISDLKSGKISDQVFRHGCVDSVAYCLYLMQE